MTPFSSRSVRLTRASTKRSRILTMTPRCFFSIWGIGARRVGGDIFSNEKAGIVYPLVVELKHSWNSPSFPSKNCLRRQLPSNAVQQFKHNLCQNKAICRALRTSPRNPRITTDVRSPFPDIRGARRRRCADGAAGRLSRGIGPPQADGIRDSPRRSATKRICRAVGRAACLAHRLYRIRRTGDRVDARGCRVRRWPLYAAGRKTGRSQGLERRAAGRSLPRKLAGEESRRRRPPRILSLAAPFGGTP